MLRNKEKEARKAHIPIKSLRRNWFGPLGPKSTNFFVKS